MFEDFTKNETLKRTTFTSLEIIDNAINQTSSDFIKLSRKTLL